MDLLSVENLNVSFGGKKILKNISFNIKSGEIVGLVGSNGAGKTTLMKTILGLVPQTTGTVSFENSKNIGALIETPALYPFLTVYDHLRLFLGENVPEAEIMRVISYLNMGSFGDKKVKDCSLGMKQRVGIAIALLNKPQFVILDEPMNGLDPKANKSLKKTIHKYSQEGTAFLISSHILSELEKIIDRTLLLKEGALYQDMMINQLKNENYETEILKYI